MCALFSRPPLLPPPQRRQRWTRTRRRHCGHQQPTGQTQPPPPVMTRRFRSCFSDMIPGTPTPQWCGDTIFFVVAISDLNNILQRSFAETGSGQSQTKTKTLRKNRWFCRSACTSIITFILGKTPRRPTSPCHRRLDGSGAVCIFLISVFCFEHDKFVKTGSGQTQQQLTLKRISLNRFDVI